MSLVEAANVCLSVNLSRYFIFVHHFTDYNTDHTYMSVKNITLQYDVTCLSGFGGYCVAPTMHCFLWEIASCQVECIRSQRNYECYIKCKRLLPLICPIDVWKFCGRIQGFRGLFRTRRGMGTHWQCFLLVMFCYEKTLPRYLHWVLHSKRQITAIITRQFLQKLSSFAT